MNNSTKSRQTNGFGRWLKVLIALGLVAGAVIGFQQLRESAIGKSESEYDEECRKLSDAEDWESLKEVATQWEASTTKPDLAHIYLADAELQLGNGEKAIEHLLKVPLSSSKSYAALITACNLQFGELNMPIGAIETLQRMIKQKPTSISSRQRLIFFYAMTLQRQKMVDAVFSAIAAKAEPPDAYAYLLMADHLTFTNGFEKNTQWLKSDPESETFQVARVIHLIQNLQSRGFNKESEDRAGPALKQYFTVFDQLRKKFPKNETLLRFAVEQAVAEFDVEKVEQLQAEIPATSDSIFLRLQAWLEFQNGEFEKCLELLNESLERYPLDWRTWNELAGCLRRTGKLEESKKAMKIALMGKALRKQVLQHDDVSAISPEQLTKIGEYAELCGLKGVSKAIYYRVELQGQIPNNNSN